MTAPSESGSLYSNSTSFASSVSVTVSTTGTNKLLVAYCTSGQGAEPSVSGASLTWTKVASVELSAAGSTWTAIYVAWAASAITSQSITASMAATATMTIDVQAYQDSQDYTSLVANTDYGVNTFSDTGDSTSNLSVSVTTKAADSELRAICSFFDSGTGITWTNNANCGTLNDNNNTVYGHLIERTDGPHSVGSYTIGADHGNSDSWRGGGIVAFEILGTGGGGGLSIPVAMNNLRNQGIA